MRPTSNFFSQEKPLPNYVLFRDNFRKAASEAGLLLSSNILPGSGISNEELTQDFAFLDHGSSTTLVHISGVHGIEGYLGSSLQTFILQNLRELHTKGIFFKNINVLFVHAVNPFGMSWYRRVNSNNVDLNRNAINSNMNLENEDFSLFAGILSSKNKQELAFRLPGLLTQLAHFGFAKVSASVGKGQWNFADNLFYGGKQMQLELQMLIEKLNLLLQKTKKCIVLDVHTGLGPFAFDSMFVANNDLAQLDFFKQFCDASHVLDVSRGNSFYQAAGTIEDHLFQSFPDKKIYYATEEFGTYNFLTVLTSLILENSSFRHEVKDLKSRRPQLLKTFFPVHKKGWQEKCFAQGFERFMQLLNSTHR